MDWQRRILIAPTSPHICFVCEAMGSCHSDMPRPICRPKWQTATKRNQNSPAVDRRVEHLDGMDPAASPAESTLCSAPQCCTLARPMVLGLGSNETKRDTSCWKDPAPLGVRNALSPHLAARSTEASMASFVGLCSVRCACGEGPKHAAHLSSRSSTLPGQER